MTAIRSDYEQCRLCPRQCGVDRTRGERGVCGETSTCRVALAEPHFGEEPCFTGTRGSGTIFFAGCSCRCFFCQNHQISLGGHGHAMDAAALLAAAKQLVSTGVHNLNFVTPDHFTPHIEALARQLRSEGIDLPLLVNSSGYHTTEWVRRMCRCVDIFVPDFKFADPDLARAVMGDARYPDLAAAGIDAMIETLGFLDPWDPAGARTARRGVLVRHLVLPGRVDNSLAVLERLRTTFGRFLPISIMRQFRPTERCYDRGFFTRAVTPEEYTDVCAEVETLGFENVFLQDPPEAKAPFLPDFSRHAVFEGNRR